MKRFRLVLLISSLFAYPAVADTVPTEARVQSVDGSLSVELHGLIQTDGRKFLGDDARAFTDTIVLRRVRPIIGGKVGEQLTYLIVPDFGEGKVVLQDAYVEWRGSEALKVKVGKFKAPFGLERLQADPNRMFVETGYTTQIAPNREIGVQIGGTVLHKRIGYAVAAVDGVVENTVAEGDTNDSKDLIGRLWLQPFAKDDGKWLKGLLIGAAYSWGDQDGSATSHTLPSFKSPGQNTIYSLLNNVKGKDAAGKDIVLPNPFARGFRTRVGVHGHWYAGPIAVLGEYVQTSEPAIKGTATMDFKASALSAQASFTLGGTASYEGVTPEAPFALGQPGWGAVEIAARFSQLKLDDAAHSTFADSSKSVKAAQTLSFGAHWHWSPRLRLFADFEHTDFTAGDVKSADRKAEDVVVSRAQLSF